MFLRKWEDLPDFMRIAAVRPYYEVLKRHRGSLVLKRLFDLVAATVLLCVLWPAMAVIAVCIARESPGPATFRQERVTTYGRKFMIYKFRTMVQDAQSIGPQLTVSHDARITPLGKKLRNSRLDELPQLFNILKGDMSFVGTRPEVPRYVARYTDEMNATLLLPAGVTSEASILYKDECRLLAGAVDMDETYVRLVLPGKMVFNLRALKLFNVFNETGTLVRTALTVMGLLNPRKESSLIVEMHEVPETTLKRVRL